MVHRADQNTKQLGRKNNVDNQSKVLFKRKPVTLIPEPQNIKNDAEVWVVPETGEIFTDYEKYLKRWDFLHQKKFTDAINGKSGLTYADAVASENQSLTEIENVFPQVLRDPILRKVQFSTISRMDELVNWVYNEFKREFFPGEDILVTLERGDIVPGTIREKAMFPMIKGPDGSVQRNAFARYFVRLHDEEGGEALIDEQRVRRDRKVYSKLNLRAFLKNSLEREAYLHAPWLVKEPLAIHYRLPMQMPEHLLKDAHLLANRAHMLQMRAPRGRQPKNMAPEEIARMQQQGAQQQQLQRQNGGALPHHPNRQAFPQVAATPPKPAPPPIKYPIEDLDVDPKKNGVARPQLSFLTEEMAHFVKNDRTQRLNNIQMETVGMLLEIWNTLNVQCEVYEIDSFTFDDFVDAMGFTTESDNTDCQLLDEAFCAVLKQLVNDQGKLEVSLPQLVEEEEPEDESESESAIDDSTVSTPVADVPARSTRSRLSHVENASEQPQSPTSAKVHNASEALAGFKWVEALGHRQMEGGGWHLILVGILNQLSHAPQFKAVCDKVLAYLVPLDMEPTKENIKYQFKTMNVNLRAAALQPMTMMSATTKALKKFLEDCSEDQTEVRKRKMEYQREKKVAMENLAYKDRDRKVAHDEVVVKEEAELAAVAEITDATSETVGGSSEAEDEASAGRRSSRKRKRGEMSAQEKERKDKADAAKAAADKQKKQHQALVRDCDLLRQQILELEAQINECDGDLREADVQRTKMLGKDRYCNRYYWFERNGQPFGGLPNSSTAHHGYANGRIWVQGPDEMERQGFIDLPKEEQIAYKTRYGMTVPERRKLEEGPTSLFNAHEWGYYEDPSVLDALISWLDDRGEREKRLRKEMYEWRDKIAKYMRAHKDFMDTEAAKRLEAEEEPKKGIATRRQAEQEKAEAGERCLRWKNLMGESMNHHLHSENPPVKKTKKNSKVATGVVINSRVSRSRAK